MELLAAEELGVAELETTEEEALEETEVDEGATEDDETVGGPWSWKYLMSSTPQYTSSKSLAFQLT